MPSFNRVILIGNLTKDPEIKYTPKGTAVCKLSIAVNRSWKTEGGEQREEVTFIDIDAFGRQAETLGQHMKKGRPIMVEGRLKLDTWDDKQTGQKRSRLGVMLESFQFLGSRESGSSEGEQSPKRERPSRADLPPGTRPAASDPDLPPQEDSDVPF